QPQWKRVYAQQSFESLPVSVDPQPGTQAATGTETNAKVLRFTASMDIQEPVPAYSMRDLTWSFWVNFVNDAATPQSAVLFSYDELRGWVKATVSNNLTPIPGAVEALQKARDDAQTAGVMAAQA